MVGGAVQDVFVGLGFDLDDEIVLDNIYDRCYRGEIMKIFNHRVRKSHFQPS